MSGAKWALGDRVLLEDFCCNLQKWPRKRSVFQCKKELFMTCFQLPLCSFWQWFCAEATPTELLIDDRNDQVSFLRRSLQDPAVNTTWNLTHLRQTAQSESMVFSEDHACFQLAMLLDWHPLSIIECHGAESLSVKCFLAPQGWKSQVHLETSWIHVHTLAQVGKNDNDNVFMGSGHPRSYFLFRKRQYVVTLLLLFSLCAATSRNWTISL